MGLYVRNLMGLPEAELDVTHPKQGSFNEITPYI